MEGIGQVNQSILNCRTFRFYSIIILVKKVALISYQKFGSSFEQSKPLNCLEVIEKLSEEFMLSLLLYLFLVGMHKCKFQSVLYN